MTRPRRPLSNSASTASWSIRFSLRMITSGALSSCRRLSRLLRLITRRYRSFRSLVAKRPPSSGTSGRRSGGITGITSRIMCSGLFPDSRKASSTLRRLLIFLRLASLFASRMSWRRRTHSSSTFSCRSMRRIADAAVLHALVLAAVALVVLDGPEDLGTEESVAFRLEGPVVDGLGLLHLAVGPLPDLLRRRDRDPQGVERERVLRLLEQVVEVAQ